MLNIKQDNSFQKRASTWASRWLFCPCPKLTYSETPTKLIISLFFSFVFFFSFLCFASQVLDLSILYHCGETNQPRSPRLSVPNIYVTTLLKSRSYIYIKVSIEHIPSFTSTALVMWKWTCALFCAHLSTIVQNLVPESSEHRTKELLNGRIREHGAVTFLLLPAY